MIRVTVTSAAGRKTENFGNSTTPREIFDHFDIDYSVATNNIDGVRLTIGDMDKTLQELGVTEECRISSMVKLDNAATMMIGGAAAVVKSDIDLEDWKRVERFAPDALKLVDEETGETMFSVGTTEGVGSINKYGVEFGDFKNGEKATVTILIDEDPDDKIQAMKDLFGRALLNLNAIEKEIPEVLKDIDKDEAEIDKLIVEQ